MLLHELVGGDWHRALTGEDAVQFREGASPALCVVVIRSAAQFGMDETHSRSRFMRREDHTHS